MHAIRRALAQLKRRPGFSAAVLLTLALGLGLTAVAFALVEAVLLRPLPYSEPERLAAVWETQPGVPRRSVAPANFLDWREAGGFAGLAAYARRRPVLAGDEPRRITIATVSANFFDVLGTAASRGRTFGPSVRPGEPRTVVLREDLWRQHFGADPAILGRPVQLDEETFLVAGVVPTALWLSRGRRRVDACAARHP